MLTVKRTPLMVEKSPITRIVQRGARIGQKDHLDVYEALPLSTVDLAAINAALSAVEEDNARLVAQHSTVIEVIESAGVQPDLPLGSPIELFNVERDGEQITFVLMVTDCIWRTSYRLAVVQADKVELSGWEQYEHPIIIGPWIHFSNYFEGSYPCLGYTDWAALSN